MRDARHDLGLNVLLDVGPWLALVRGFAGQQLPQIAWLDGRHNFPSSDVVIVADDCARRYYFIYTFSRVASLAEGGH